MSEPAVIDLDDPYFESQDLVEALADYEHVHSTTGACIKNGLEWWSAYCPTPVETWPCDNYAAPLTCLTAPSSETGRCDWCRSILAMTRARVQHG